MKAKPINSNRSLAQRIGCDERTVRGWLRDGRWPFARTAPWLLSELPAMKRWRAATLEQQHDANGDDEALAGLSAERREKVELIIERKLKVRLERELLAGRYLLRETAQADLLTRANEAKATLQGITGLAPRLVGKDEAEVRRLLDEHVRLCCGILANGGAPA